MNLLPYVQSCLEWDRLWTVSKSASDQRMARQTVNSDRLSDKMKRTSNLTNLSLALHPPTSPYISN